MPRKNSKYTGDGLRKAVEKLAAHYRVHIKQSINSYIEKAGKNEYRLVFCLVIFFHCSGKGL